MLLVNVDAKQHWCLIRMQLPLMPKVEVDNGLVAVHCAHGLNRWGVGLSCKIAEYFCLIGWNSSLTMSWKILLADENCNRVSKFLCQDRLLDLPISDSEVRRWTQRSSKHVIQLETKQPAKSTSNTYLPTYHNLNSSNSFVRKLLSSCSMYTHMLFLAKIWK